VTKLKDYLIQVNADEDRPLLEEALVAAEHGAFRAAYIVTWLACAESFRRRFREAKVRDANAAKIHGEIERKENNHQSVDLYLLGKAVEYGFVTDVGKTQLQHIYDMRCVYGHPYEEAPGREQVEAAVYTVVDLVLSRPFLLRHGFLVKLLDDMTGDVAFIDDLEKAVEKFADEMIPRIDDGLKEWLLVKYWGMVESMVGDPSLSLYTRRARWFSQRLLGSIAAEDERWTTIDWVGHCQKFPSNVSWVLTRPTIFDRLSERIQDYVVGKIIELSKESPRLLSRLELLRKHNKLKVRNIEKVDNRVADLSSAELGSSGLPLSLSFDAIIRWLKSRNWPTQAPAVRHVTQRGKYDIALLTPERQEILGRNILQAADGSERTAQTLLCAIAEDTEPWPPDFIGGIVKECFMNEAVKFDSRHTSTTGSISR